jgi:hypothetical protein
MERLFPEQASQIRDTIDAAAVQEDRLREQYHEMARDDEDYDAPSESDRTPSALDIQTLFPDL